MGPRSPVLRPGCHAAYHALRRRGRRGGGELVTPSERRTGLTPRRSLPLPRQLRAATHLWHQFEKIAGVAIIENHGWYGVRRTGANLAEDVETGGRALNAITGHDSDEMCRKIYQEKIRNAVLGRAATAREAARQLAIEAAIAAGDAASQNGTGTSTWERRQADKRARRAAAHAQQRKEGRRPPTYPTKACERCGVVFQPTGANTRACAACSPRRVRPKPAQA